MNTCSYTTLLRKFTIKKDSYLTTKQLSHVCRVSFFLFFFFSAGQFDKTSMLNKWMMLMLKEWREIITYIKNKHIYKQGADARFITDVYSFKHAASTFRF